jgi:hypothetical protein
VIYQIVVNESSFVFGERIRCKAFLSVGFVIDIAFLAGLLSLSLLSSISVIVSMHMSLHPAKALRYLDLLLFSPLLAKLLCDRIQRVVISKNTFLHL